MQEKQELNQGASDIIASPLVTLGALYWASENRPEFTGFENGRDLLVMAFGGGSSEWFINQIKNVMPSELGLGDEAIQGIAGALLVRYGDRLHEQVQNIGRGVIMDLGIRVIKESEWNLQNLVGGVLGQPCNESAKVNVEQDNAPEPPGGYNKEGSPMTMAEYIKREYNVALS